MVLECFRTGNRKSLDLAKNQSPATYPSFAKKPDGIDCKLGWVLNSKEVTSIKLANKRIINPTQET